MGHSHYHAAASDRRLEGGKDRRKKRPLTLKQIWSIRFFLDREGRVRDCALFDLAVDSRLRGCDLVKIKTGDFEPDKRGDETTFDGRTRTAADELINVLLHVSFLVSPHGIGTDICRSVRFVYLLHCSAFQQPDLSSIVRNLMIALRLRKPSSELSLPAPHPRRSAALCY